MKKPLWRLIVGILLVAGASNSLRQAQIKPDSVSLITHYTLILLIAGIGVWLAVSYFRRSN